MIFSYLSVRYAWLESNLIDHEEGQILVWLFISNLMNLISKSIRLKIVIVCGFVPPHFLITLLINFLIQVNKFRVWYFHILVHDMYDKLWKYDIVTSLSWIFLGSAQDMFSEKEIKKNHDVLISYLILMILIPFWRKNLFYVLWKLEIIIVVRICALQ